MVVAVGSGGCDAMRVGRSLAVVAALEAIAKSAVVANSDRASTQLNDFDRMRMAAVGIVGMVASMHRSEGGIHDGFRAVRAHGGDIGPRLGSLTLRPITIRLRSPRVRSRRREDADAWAAGGTTPGS